MTPDQDRPDHDGPGLPGASLEAPEVDGGPHETYRALLGRDVLGFQVCGACVGAVFPPRGRCPHCGADALGWRASAGVGTIYSTTVLSPRDRPAYAVVLVDLDEGFRMMSRIVEAEADRVAIDDRVAVRFEPAETEVLPLFAPVGAAR